MTTQTLPVNNTIFKLGWAMLLGIALLATINHLALAYFMPNEATLFLGWAAATAYAAGVLAVPYRRGERWAWYSIWIMVALFASLILFDSQVGVYYVIAAGLMTVGQFLTVGVFFNRG